MRGLPQRPDHFTDIASYRYRHDTADVGRLRLIVTGRQISAREARAMVAGTNVPDMISGPVSEYARLLLANAGEAVAIAVIMNANAADRIIVILAPTSSSSAAPQPCRSGGIR